MRTTPLGARTRLLLTSLLVTSALLLAGCGGTSDRQADPAPSATSASSSVSAEPSESASTTPATGKPVDTSTFRVNVPEGWRVTVVVKDFVIVADDPKSSDAIAFTITDAGGASPTLDELADQALQGSWPGGKKPSVVAETELGGEPAYHLTGSGGGAKVDARGLVHGAANIEVEFDTYGSAAHQESVVESVLATWRWK